MLLSALAHAFPESPSRVRARDDDDNYFVSVCLPSAAPDATGVVPPCIDIITIETACTPNGTSPLALEAHAQCLCGGSYFAEWLACRRCLEVHGILSPQNYSYYSTVLSSASEELCTGTPTAALAQLWTQVQAGVPEPTAAGDTTLTDISSGDAAVSLYYTPTGPQGPGVITGSATEATTKVSNTIGSLGTTGHPASTTSTSAGSADAKTTTSTTSSSSNIAAPTGAAGGGKGAFFAAALGGAVLAAL